MNTLFVGYRFKEFIENSFIQKESEIDILFDQSLILEVENPPKTTGYDLVIWDSNLPVEKDKGSVLICVGNDNIGESLSRVFRIKANAVIYIKDNLYELVDALGNLWCRTSDGVELLNNILKLYKWTKSSIRRQSMKSDVYLPYDVNSIEPELNKFCDIIKQVSDSVEKERGGRYFGNASTRCSKMFPSVRSKYEEDKKSSGYHQYILVSKRNIPKDKIKPNDFVVTRYGGAGDFPHRILYFGEDKPSVDTPSQIELYREFPKINYMIHGHAYISSEFLGLNLIHSTDKYCSCGDLREVQEIKKYIHHEDCDFFIINLINHGFIIATDTLEQMKSIVEHKNTNFIYRKIGEEKPKI